MKNMKKIYVTPSTMEIEIETLEMLAASAPRYRSTLENTSNNKSRGEWGNLWE